MTMTNRVVLGLAGFALAVVMVACGTIDLATPGSDAMDRLVIRPSANPLASARERLARYQRMAEEAERAGESLPADVQENLDFLEGSLGFLAV